MHSTFDWLNHNYALANQKLYYWQKPLNMEKSGEQFLKPGHTELYSLITAKSHQKVVSHEADDVVHVDVVLKTSYGGFIDVAGCREKSEWRWTW